MSDAIHDDDTLLRGLVDGTLDTGSRQQLQHRLRADAALRRDCRELLQIHALLRWRSGQVASAGTVQAVRMPAPRSTFRRWAMAAAALLLVGLGLGAWQVATRASPGVLVQVLAADGVEADQTLTVTRSVRLERLTVRTGLVRLALPEEVTVDIIAPATVAFLTPMHLQVYGGQVTAEVGERGHGFRIDTPTAQVVDLGTRFGVAVDAQGHSDVVVFKGTVEVRSAQAGADEVPLRLTGGEAMRMAAGRPGEPLQQILVDALNGRWSTATTPCSARVGTVRDNRIALKERRFYEVVPGGMRAGAQAYTAGRGFWHACESGTFPAFLLNADLVRTFGPLRQDLDLSITLVLGSPAHVYVLMDAAIMPPDWLARDFQRTGAQVRRDNRYYKPTDKPNLAPTWTIFDVWERVVAGPGPVVLGPPLASASAHPGAMYGIAVGP